jgi:hypothetical protein
LSLTRYQSRAYLANGKINNEVNRMPLLLTPEARSTAGVLLLTLVAVEYGGWFMLRVVRGHQSATEFQKAFFRAGHAHAGVLVTLSLVAQLLVSAAGLSGLSFALTSGIWVAAILMPAGFFLSAAGRNRTHPSQLIILLYAGMIALAIGVISLGLGLLGVFA